MTEATLSTTKRSTTKRVLRILLGGIALASAWLAVDLLVHADSASASETVDVLPVDLSGGSDPVADIIGSVVTRVAPIAAPVAQVTTPIVSPVVEVVTPVVEAATTPLAPVVAPIVGGIVEGVVGALPVVPQLNITPNLGALVSGGGLVLGAVLGASLAPLLPLPVNGGNRNGPVAPESPGGAAAAAAANLHSLVVPGPGSALRRSATTGEMPVSPTYGFDTTPD